jgi:hypothetical protein
MMILIKNMIKLETGKEIISDEEALNRIITEMNKYKIRLKKQRMEE